ncbi:hypothetical protein C8046_00820 [Serinibacter arcticus]|uniref:Integral membrane protein n=1 Tax=Serinibacter arcticus TaxID=1655435 RepID=A0A2U1ZR63_9MICO|nr:hypothetical protein [Serinibacter arcticus]PWD49477.1 hypothetical protein C8046_00820 [Serinibacter arcticus]
MTDPNTPGGSDRPEETTPQTPGHTPPAPQPPGAPAWGAPPPPPSSPQVPGYGAPQQPAAPTPPPPSYDGPPAPPSAYPSPDQGGFPPPQQGGFPPPPQQGGFPPPPQGGFPPPPQGGFPTPPAAYAGGGYVSPPDVGQAFSWGWSKFKDNWVSLVVSHLLWGIVVGAVGGIGIAIATATGGASTTANTDTGVAVATSLGLGGIIIVSILTVLISFIALIGLTNGYLTIADGRRSSIGDFFKFRNVGQGVLLSLLLGVASGLLSFTGIGSLVVQFFGIYAMFFVVDRGLSAIDAIKASVDLAIKNAAQTALLVLLTILCGFGALLCGVGLLVTIPLAYLAATYLYRRLSGASVAA